MVINRLILQHQIPGIEWFVPSDYQPRFIAELLDVYDCYWNGPSDLCETKDIGMFHDMTVELAGLYEENNESHFYNEADQLFKDDNDRVEHVREVADSFSEEMEYVCNKTLDYYHMTYEYHSTLIRHYAKEVW